MLPSNRSDRALLLPLFCLALVPVVTPRAAQAADYFVATDGNDDASGTTVSRPFRTVRRAVEAATQPGDTVWIRGGVYPADNWNNQLSLRYSGTAEAPITFRNYPGELPILDGSELYEDGASGVEPVPPATQPVAHIRIIGIVARNWGTSGFSNGWPGSQPNLASSNISFIHCIADGNGINGFSFAGASNLYIEGSIAAHNGARLPSWSSGFSLYAARGNNILDGNVAFENIDVSARPEFGGRPTDGNGFILDEDSTHGYIVNNIAFRNGGSCMRVTDSSGANITNNTCFQNGQDSNAQYNSEVYLSEQRSGEGTTLRNNAGIAGPRGDYDGQGMQFVSANRNQNNLWLAAGNSPFMSISGNLDFRLASGASQLINQGTSTNAPATDIGFDPQCIKQQSGLSFWWQYAIDYDYIESVGGVAGCFRNRVARPAGGGIDIGAYESNGTPVGCANDAECSDGVTCTEDLCDPGRKCVNLPIEGCCTTDADCTDGDACTMDSCDTATSQCVYEVDPVCGVDPSGDFSVSNWGYASVCNWGGFMWTHAGPSEAGVAGTVSSIESLGSLCYSGVVAAHEGYNGIAMLGFNINQANGNDTPAENTTLGGAGINLSLVNKMDAPLRIQIQDAPDAGGSSNIWCVEVEGSGGFYPWSDFNTHCWSDDEGDAYAGQPVNVIAITVAGHNEEDRGFEFCLNSITPSGDECVRQPDGSPGNNGDGPGGGGDGNGNSGPGAGDGGSGQDGDPGHSEPGAGSPGSSRDGGGADGAACACKAGAPGSGAGGLMHLAGLLFGITAFSRRRMRLRIRGAIGGGGYSEIQLR